MKLLVIGSGGREHALVWKLAQSPRARRIWCAPGNAGMASEPLLHGPGTAECVPIGAEDLAALLRFAQDRKPDLTVVGPDNPLALGIVDLFQKHGLRIWGPNQSAARFESSKVFAQEFMRRHGIPSARAGTFGDPREAIRFAERLDGRCAVKADGLALGKGVLLTRSMEEARQAIHQIMVDQAFGEAGRHIVIQERLEGVEVSLHALCDGRTARLFQTAQDHKHAFDGDTGPNTGGMGTYSPAPFLSGADLQAAADAVIGPWLKGCAAEGIDFRGILYPGLMLTREGPRVLEFNARFGDPETQVYLPRLKNDLVDLLEACIDGTLDKVNLEWSAETAVCVVMASGGYPGNYAKGHPIEGLERVATLARTKVFHAGTRMEGERILTSGGRVLGVTTWGEDLAAARRAAYDAVAQIRFENAQFRTDIALKGLVRRGA